MKKLFVLSLMLFCFSPVFAQGGKVVKSGVDAMRGASLLQKISAQEVARQAAASAVRLVQITNMPGKPLVKLGTSLSVRDEMGARPSAVLPARMLPGPDSYYFLRPADPIGRYTGDYFVPQDILGNEVSFYRGMRLGKIDDVKNLLINGLERNKSHYDGIYASFSFPIPVLYATIGAEPNLQVLIKIPATQPLRLYAPESFPDDRYAAKAFQMGEEVIFQHDIPARFISDVWVFLEVNGQPDWYKATLQDGEVVLTPVPGRTFTKEELSKHKFGRDEE